MSEPLTDSEVQHKTLLFLIKNRSGIIGSKVGSGKTRSFIRYVGLVAKRSEKPLKILVITKKILPAKFRQEVFTHLDKEVWGKVTFQIIHHEYILRPEVHHTILSKTYDFVLIDEVHKFNNRKTELFKSVKKLAKDWKAKGTRVVVMTADVWVNKDYDIWALLHIVNPVKYSSFWTFIDDHFNWVQNRFGFREIKVVKNKEAFLNSFKDDLFIGDTEYLCPEPNIHVIRKSEHEECVYELARNYVRDRMFADNKDNLVIIKNKISFINLLRGLSVCPQHTLKTKKNWKFDECINILADFKGCACIGTSLPLCFPYLETILKQALGSDRMILRLDSTVPDYQDVIDRYKAADNAILLMSKHLSEGFDLVNTKRVISLDDHWTHKTNNQFMGRFLRRGQLYTVDIFKLYDDKLGDSFVNNVLEDKERFNFFIDKIMETSTNIQISIDFDN